MNLVLYTIAPDSKGGGGRRVFTGLLNGFINLGYAVFVVSEKKYPISLRGYEQDTCEYFNLSAVSERPLLATNSEIIFQNYIKEKKIDVILCDTEYSLANFVTCLPKFCKKFSVQIYTLCHDQIWRDYMSLCGYSHDDCTAHPYYKYSEYLSGVLYPIRSKWQRTMERTLQTSKMQGKYQLRYLIRAIAPRLMKSVGAVKAYIRLEKVRKNIAITAGVVSLTERSAREAEQVYRLRSGQSIACYGYVDEELRRFKARCESLLINSKKIIAFCRLGPEKNLDLVIFTFIEASKTDSDLKLTIIGRNDSSSTFEHVVYLTFLIERLGCGDKVKIIENPSDETLIKEIGTSNVMICAQNCDFNLTIYEAMYLGKQVVVPATYSFPKELAKSRNIYANNIQIEDFTSSILEATDVAFYYDESEREFLASRTYDNYAASVSAFLEQKRRLSEGSYL